MAQLKIKLEQKSADPQHGQISTQEVVISDFIIKLYDGDKLVAETSVENMVKKFLVISAEYAQMLYAVGAIKPSKESKIVINGEEKKEEDNAE